MASESVKTTRLQNRSDKKIYSLNRAGRSERRRLLIEEEPWSTMRDELLVHILAAQQAPHWPVADSATGYRPGPTCEHPPSQVPRQGRWR